MKKNRTEQISIRATKDTKYVLDEYKKRTGKSAADVLEDAVCNIVYDDTYILLRIRSIDEMIDTYKMMVSEIDEMIKKLSDEKEKLLMEHTHIEYDKNSAAISDVLNSYNGILAQHTDSYGYVDESFDALKVLKRLCVTAGVDYNEVRELVL